ncbi:MAG: glycosyltransferase [Chloroflexota bacterium]
MRILYVTNDLPWPLTSGYLRHFHFIRELSARHRVTLLSLVRRDHGPGDVAALEPFTERVVTVPATFGRRTLAGRLGARARGLASGGDRAALDLGRLGASLASEAPFDALLLSGKRTYPVLRELPSLPLVADLCDATSSRIRRQARHARLVRRPSLALEYVEIRRVERALVARADHVLFASARDRDAIMGRTGGRAVPAVVPNGVDGTYWRRTSPTLGVDRIVMTGAMDYPPNVDAAVRLVTEILPLVHTEIPGAKVLIVGRDPSPVVGALASRPGVTVTGFVDDVRPYLDSAAVFAAPIRFGAGIQNKVLEAMAMEVPVVASPLAADGLRTEDGRTPPIDVARDAADTARLLIGRLRAAAASAGPDPALRAYVTDAFDWGRNAARVEALLAQAAGRGTAAPGDDSP